MAEIATMLLLDLVKIDELLADEDLDRAARLIGDCRVRLKEMYAQVSDVNAPEIDEALHILDVSLLLHESHCLSLQGQYEAAKKALASANVMVDRHSLPLTHMILHAYANLEMREGKADGTTVDTLIESLTLSIKLEDWLHAGNVAFNLATLYNIDGQKEKAREKWAEAAEFYLRSITPNISRKLIDCIHMLAVDLRASSSDDQQATELLRRALDWACGLEALPAVERIAGDLALTYVCRHYAGESGCIEKAKQALDHVRYAREKLWEAAKRLDEPRPALIRRAQEGYNNLQTELEVLHVLQDEGHAFPLLAQAKGRVVRETRPASWRDEVERYRSCDDQWSELPTDELALAVFSAPLKDLSKQMHAPVAILEHYAMAADLLATVAVVADEKDTEVCFTITSWPESPPTAYSGAAFHGEHQGARGRALADETLKELEQYTDRMVFLTDPGSLELIPEIRSAVLDDCTALEARLRVLGTWLFPEDILKMLEDLSVQHVVVCPDPRLFSLPWLALHLGPHGYVLDQTWTLSLLPSSLSIYDVLRRRRCKLRSEITVLAPDRDLNLNRGGNKDIETVWQVREGMRLFMEARASLATLQEAAPTSGWIHLSMHGRITKEGEYYPVLAGGEVWDKALIGDSCHPVLVSAACGTGATTASGQDVFGFALVVDESDFRSMVAPVFPVDGIATALWTDQLYGHLDRGDGLAKSCQKACRALRDRLLHPAFWSAFVCVGDFDSRLPGETNQRHRGKSM
ncbi:MAG: CHAT domain-containing protein [Vulcanimicrobiota bacterium]